jgi:hypothetical protein
VQVYIHLGIIEPIGDLLSSREIARIAQIRRLRQDLGLNIIGAAMVCDMVQEITQIRVQLKAHQKPETICLIK